MIELLLLLILFCIVFAAHRIDQIWRLMRNKNQTAKREGKARRISELEPIQPD
jgi:hypothetical protein